MPATVRRYTTSIAVYQLDNESLRRFTLALWICLGQVLPDTALSGHGVELTFMA